MVDQRLVQNQYARSSSEDTLVDTSSSTDHDESGQKTMAGKYNSTPLVIDTIIHDDDETNVEGDDDDAVEVFEDDIDNSLLPREQIDIPVDNVFAQLKDRGLSEGSLIAKLVLPISLAGLLELVLSFMNVFALGHLGATELAAGSLGATFVNVTGFALYLGMNTAFDTLGSQSYSGTKDRFALGVILQRSLFINFLLTIPITCMWVFAEPILVLLGQDPHLSHLAGLYCRYNLPAVFLFPLMDNFRRFLAVQGLTYPPTIIFAVGVPLHILSNYLFILHPSTSIGLLGAPLANSCTYTLIVLMFLFYFKFIYVNRVWNGFSMKAFHSLPQYVRIGLPGIAMVCTDWWAWDLVTIISGWFGETTLAAQSVVLTTYLVFFQVPHGIGSGANARIGNLLGSQCPQLTRLSTIVIQLLGAMITGTLAILTYFGRSQIASLFTQDPEVTKMVTDAMLVVSCLVFADGCVTVVLGILRGCGKQTTGAVLLFVGYYVVGIPSGVYLSWYGIPFTSVKGLGLVGLYSGLLLSLILMFIACSSILLSMDWDTQVELCMKRLRKAHCSSTKTPLGYGLVPDSPSGETPTSALA